MLHARSKILQELEYASTECDLLNDNEWIGGESTRVDVEERHSEFKSSNTSDLPGTDIGSRPFDGTGKNSNEGGQISVPSALNSGMVGKLEKSSPKSSGTSIASGSVSAPVIEFGSPNDTKLRMLSQSKYD